MSVMLFNEIKELFYTDEMFHVQTGMKHLDQDTVDMIVAYAPSHCERLRAELARKYYDESLDRLYTEYVTDLGRLSVLAMIAMLRSPRNEAKSPRCGDLIQETANQLQRRIIDTVFKEHKESAPSELEFTLDVDGYTSTEPSLVLAVRGRWSMVSVCDLSSITEADIRHLCSKGVDGLILNLINGLLAGTVLRILEPHNVEIIIHPTPSMYLKVPPQLVGDPIVISGLTKLRNQFIEFSNVGGGTHE